MELRANCSLLSSLSLFLAFLCVRCDSDTSEHGCSLSSLRTARLLFQLGFTVAVIRDVYELVDICRCFARVQTRSAASIYLNVARGILNKMAGEKGNEGEGEKGREFAC